MKTYPQSIRVTQRKSRDQLTLDPASNWTAELISGRGGARHDDARPSYRANPSYG